MMAGDLSRKTFADQQKINDNGLNRIFEVGFENNISVEAAINIALKDKTVEYAVPSFIYHTFIDPNEGVMNLQLMPIY